MQIDLDVQRLPQIYKRSGKDCYLDGIRQRLINITPEETVRQHVISYILDELKVPANAVRIEEHLSHYGIQSRRRADIIIERYSEEDNTRYPLVVIECKAPQVAISDRVFDQVEDYADMLGADYAMATNGYEAEFLHYNSEKDSYEFITELPKYIDMVKGKFTPIPEAPHIERFSFKELMEEEKWKEYVGDSIGDDTPAPIARAAANLLDSLLFSDRMMRAGKYRLFRLIEDYGLRNLEYGNASGGHFQGLYHSYLVEYNKNTEIVSLGLSAYITSGNPDRIRTTLNAAIDNEKVSHHSLQLVLDDNLAVSGNKCTFYHHGRITVGNKGSGKLDKLRVFIADRYPDIIDGSRFNLGTIVNDHLWNADEDDMCSFLENVISYALIRDEYREYIKMGK